MRAELLSYLMSNLTGTIKPSNELPFDQGLMEETIVDTKVDNLLGVLDWDLQNQTSASNEIFSSLFTFN